MLEVDEIDVSYDGTQVLNNVSLKINEGEIVAIVGSNGAGKSTLLKTISGLERPSKGSIRFFNESIDSIPPRLIIEKGIIQVPEGRKIFPSLTVLENLEMGSYIKKARVRRKETLEQVFKLFSILEERKDQLAGTLLLSTHDVNSHQI